jgi:hypothetical protein
MEIVMDGIVHGKTIVLESDPGLEDGKRVKLVLRLPTTVLGPPPKWTPGCTVTAGGMMADDWTEEDDRILEEIYQDRKGTRKVIVP